MKKPNQKSGSITKIPTTAHGLHSSKSPNLVLDSMCKKLFILHSLITGVTVVVADV